MTTYYVIYPRDFCNEYDVYATEDRDAFESAFPDASRVSRKEAIRLGWSRPKEADRDGEQWFGGFFNDGRDSGETLDDALAACRDATDTQVNITLQAREAYPTV